MKKKHLFRFVLALVVYAVFLIVIDWILGIGIHDTWDKLMDWANKKNHKR
ncbi:hypothetical protein HNQ56_002363 [Anaerotaenia torta]